MKKDYRYLAGIIDGEGCVNITRNNEKLRLRLKVNNTSEDLVFWLKENFGGRAWFLERPEPWKDCWEWQVTAQGATNILKNILPLLIIKKQQAKLAVEFQRTMRYSGKKVPVEVEEQREECYNLMKQLNHRGK